MKLYPKILGFLLVLISLSLWAGIYFSQKAVRKVLGEQITNAASMVIADNLSGFKKALISRKEADGIKVLYACKQRSDLIYAGLLDANHMVIAHTNVTLVGNKIDISWAGHADHAGTIFRRITYKGNEIIEALIPIKTSAQIASEKLLLDDTRETNAGFVLAGLSLTPIHQSERDIVWKLLLTTIMISFSALIASAFFVRLLLRQVGLLEEGMRKVRNGDLLWTVRIESKDEIGGLAGFFNEMLSDLRNSKTIIESYQAQLEEKIKKRTKELERSQEHLMQASKMAAVGQLVSGVAHELNNPLTGIMGYAQVLIKEGGLSEQQREDIMVIDSQAARAKGIIQDLLQFSRKREVKREVVNIAELVEGALKLLNYEFSVSGIVLVKDLPRSLPAVFGDPSQLQQVFLNIISNAKDAMTPGGGKLLITASASAGKLVLRFADTGPGIPNEVLDRIFEPFFTTKVAGKGTGLGLSISYEIVKNHNGVLSVENGLNGGAAFTLELPVHNATS